MEKDMSGMLGAILSDPSAVAQIASLAKTLGPALEGGMRPSGQAGGGAPDCGCSVQPVPARPSGDLSAIAKCCALLEALRLFTEGERRGRIERLLSVLKLAKNIV